MGADIVAPHPTSTRNAELVVARYGAFGQRWLDGLRRGDPTADRLVASFTDRIGHATGFRVFQRALADGIEATGDPPPELIALFAELDEEPGWLDHDRCDRAAEHIVRQGRQFGLVLAAASLPAGARNPIAAKPLQMTGRYGSQPALRSIEVGNWLTAVTTPGGVRRDGEGFALTARVRLVHAMIRNRLLHDGRWDLDAWGLPIPQPYMAYTLAEFCSVALRAMAKLGVRYSDADLADIFHLWRYVGYLIGVEEELNPLDQTDYDRIETLYELVGEGVDDYAREFIDGLTTFQAGEISRALPPPLRPLARPLIEAYQRALIGDELAGELGVPDTPLKHLISLTAPLTTIRTQLYDTLVPAGRARRTARAFKQRERGFERMRATYGIEHQMVDDAPA